jgi:hypothetical protein
VSANDAGSVPIAPEWSATGGEGLVRWAWRWGVRTLVVGLVALAVALGYGAINYQPLGPGSSAGGTDPYLVSSVMSPFGDGVMFTFCHDPGKLGHVVETFRNDGPVPITLIGSASGPEEAIQLIGLASLRARNPDGSIDGSTWLDAATASALQPTVIDPGAELEVWLAFRLPSVPMSAGSTMSTRSLPIKFSVFGFERSVQVEMRDGFAFSGDPCPAK